MPIRPHQASTPEGARSHRRTLASRPLTCHGLARWDQLLPRALPPPPAPSAPIAADSREYETTSTSLGRTTNEVNPVLPGNSCPPGSVAGIDPAPIPNRIAGQLAKAARDKENRDPPPGFYRNRNVSARYLRQAPIVRRAFEAAGDRLLNPTARLDCLPSRCSLRSQSVGRPLSDTVFR